MFDRQYVVEYFQNIKLIRPKKFVETLSFLLTLAEKSRQDMATLDEASLPWWGGGGGGWPHCTEYFGPGLLGMQTLPNLYVEVGWRRGESREGRDHCEVPFV